MTVTLVALLLMTSLSACAQSTDRESETDKTLQTEEKGTVAKKKLDYEPGELANTEWVLTSLNGYELVDNSAIFLSFDKDSLG